MPLVFFIGNDTLTSLSNRPSVPPPPGGTGLIPIEAITMYYIFNGQRIALRNNHTIGGDSFAYLHSDHLGSVMAATNHYSDPRNSGDETR